MIYSVVPTVYSSHHLSLDMLYSVVLAGVALYIATSYNFKLKLHLDVTSCFHLFQHCQYFQGKNSGAGKGAGVGE